MIRANVFLGVALPVVLAAVGCSSSSDTGAGNDVDSGSAAQDSGGGTDSATPGNDSGTPAVDANVPGNDAATGAKQLGDPCTAGSECASGLCEAFRMQAVMLCTKPCTPATQAADCPSPPTDGTCTPKMYCRFQ